MNKAICFVLTLSRSLIATLRTARHLGYFATQKPGIGDGRTACMGAIPIAQKQKTCSIKKTGERLCQLLNNIALSRPGGHGGVAAPVPIPNTAVKRPSANGTSSQDAGE